MIDILLPSSAEKRDSFSTQPLDSKALGKEALRQKLANLRKRMATCEQRVDVIKQEQAAMEHTAVVIQHDQEEIARGQEQLKERQLSVTQDIKQVKQNHVNIQQMEAILSLTVNALVYCALSIYNNQKKVKTEWVNIENNQQKIQQHAIRIHRNVPTIVQHFQKAWQNVRAIENKAICIQKVHQAIEATVTKMKEKRDYIRDNIPLLIPGLPGDRYEKSQSFRMKKKMTQVEAVGGIKRIQDFCLWLMRAICERIYQLYQYMKSWSVTADFSFNHLSSSLINWIVMGILATTGMVEVNCSWDLLTLKGSLIDLKANH